MPFVNHMRGFNTRNDSLCTMEILEPHHGSGYSLNGPVVLFNDVVKILALTHLNVSAGVSDDTKDGCGIGAAFVNRDRIR